MKHSLATLRPAFWRGVLLNFAKAMIPWWRRAIFQSDELSVTLERAAGKQKDWSSSLRGGKEGMGRGETIAKKTHGWGHILDTLVLFLWGLNSDSKIKKNRLASLKATLFRKYDLPTDRLAHGGEV